MTASNSLGSSAATSAAGAVVVPAAAPASGPQTSSPATVRGAPAGSAPLGPATRAATASHARLNGIGTGQATLSFTLTAGTHAAGLDRITISLPTGLGFSRSKRNLATGILVRAGGRQLKFSAKGGPGQLTITLRAPHPRVRFILAITSSRTLAMNARGGKVKTLRIGLTATDAQHVTTPITLKLGAR